MPTNGVRIERWTEGLDPEQDAWLKDGLISGLPGLRMAELFIHRPWIFHDHEYLVVAVDVARCCPLAVLAADWHTTGDGLRFLHIGVQFVVEEARGGDIFRLSWRELLAAVCQSGRFPTVSVLKTFNPIAFCAMRAYGRLPGTVMYPDLAEREVDPVLAKMANEIAHELAPDHPFDALTGVIRGVGLPKDLYSQRPTCHDAHVNTYFASHLSPGDRLLTFVLVGSSNAEKEIEHGFQPAASG
jgi:hypothetical protein